MTLGHNGAYFPSRVDNLIKFEFTEHEWRHVPETSFTPLNDQNTPLLHPEEYQYLYGDDYNYQPGGDGVGGGGVCGWRLWLYRQGGWGCGGCRLGD